MDLYAKTYNLIKIGFLYAKTYKKPILISNYV